MKVLKFYSDTCGPCKVLTKTLEPVKDQITEVNVFEDMDLAQQYGVRKVPTTVFIDDNNQEVSRIVGTYTLEEYHESYLER